MMERSREKNIYYTLRIASAMCFIGHGAFGIITKAIWCNYFGVFGIGHNEAYTLMPYVGVIDICCGLLILFYPLRIVFGWLIVWGTFTALLRPLSGEPFAEFIERAGNYGAPLALLLLTYSFESRWLKPVSIKHVQFNKTTIKRLKICLRVVVFLLFVGHGWLNLIEKKIFARSVSFIRFFKCSKCCACNWIIRNTCWYYHINKARSFHTHYIFYLENLQRIILSALGNI